MLFRSSRHWVTPNPDYHRPVTDEEKWLFRNVPRYLSWYRVLQFWNSADRIYPAFRVDPEWADQDVSISRQNDKLRQVMTAHAERELAAAIEDRRAGFPLPRHDVAAARPPLPTSPRTCARSTRAGSARSPACRCPTSTRVWSLCPALRRG